MSERELMRIGVTRGGPWYDSLFAQVSDEYFKVAMGFYIDFPAMLEAETDFAERVDQEEVSFWEGVGRLLLSQLTWLRYIGLHVYPPDGISFEWEWADTAWEMHKAVMYTIKNVERPLFMIVHYSVPHFPYKWDARGLIPVEERERLGKNNERGYLNNLRGADYLAGEIIHALKEVGRYDHARLIITSDHGWRQDPRVRQERSVGLRVDSSLRHVPLFVKGPGQQKGEMNTNKTWLIDLELGL